MSSLRSFPALLAAAVLGGGVAVAAVALLGGLEGDTTMVTETVQAAPRLDGHSRGDDERQRDLRALCSGGRPDQRDEQLDLGDRSARWRVAGPAGARLRLRHRQDRPHRHELPRRRRGGRGDGRLLESRHGQGRDRRHRSVHRPRRPPRRDVGERSHAAASRRLRQGASSATPSSRSGTRSGSTEPRRPGS